MSGKAVLITGSGAGIGRETAFVFARAGYHVIVNSMSASGQAVCDEITGLGQQAAFIQADVSREKDAERLVRQAVEWFDGLDVLVNCAGIVPGGNVEQTDAEVWDHAMAVNVKSVYLMSRFALPHLRKRMGCIVNLASAVALKGVCDRALYAATKGAVLSLSRSMAREYVQDGVRVNCVSPGSILTPSLKQRIQASDDPETSMRNMVARQPIGRLGTPEEVAAAVLYLASDAAGYITGTNLIIDGGMTM